MTWWRASRRPRSPSRATSPTSGRSKAYMEAGTATFGKVDLYHLNAGIFGTFAALPDLSTEEFDRVMAVNLRGQFLGVACRLSPVPRPEQRGSHCRYRLYRQPCRQRRPPGLPDLQTRGHRPHPSRGHVRRAPGNPGQRRSAPGLSPPNCSPPVLGTGREGRHGPAGIDYAAAKSRDTR